MYLANDLADLSDGQPPVMITQTADPINITNYNADPGTYTAVSYPVTCTMIP